MSALTFYFKVLQALEEIEAPYMIVGAFAGLAFGVNRATFDIDIPSTGSRHRLVDLGESDFEALAARFPWNRKWQRCGKRWSTAPKTRCGAIKGHNTN